MRRIELNLLALITALVLSGCQPDRNVRPNPSNAVHVDVQAIDMHLDFPPRLSEEDEVNLVVENHAVTNLNICELNRFFSLKLTEQKSIRILTKVIPWGCIVTEYSCRGGPELVASEPEWMPGKCPGR